MAGERSFLAFDLGAESGRAMLGSLQGGRLKLQEISRFVNGMLRLRGHWHWNIYRLFEEIVRAIGLCSRDGGGPGSIGVDTWGVDFGLLSADGSILGLPFAYRDDRTEGIMEKLFERVPRDRIYALTGIQFLRFNSLFQLYAMRLQRSPLLDAAEDLLFMPDLFHYLLTGRRSTEFSYATTSQLYNPTAGAWEPELFESIEIPMSLMQPICQPGDRIGTLHPELARSTGAGEVEVVAAATHDTASAVAGVPAEGTDWAYISSGTWSLMGIECERPVIHEKAQESNFTNEGGVGGRFRFLKNISGLWLLQASRRSWSPGKPPEYGELVASAEGVPAFRSIIDPDHGSFLNPPDMPEAIREFCRRSRQPVPETAAAVVRCILESLALKYRCVLDQLRSVCGRPIERIHIIGGGARNELLCRFTAAATGLLVTAGPAEATAAGNILVQALGRGLIEDLSELRGIVRRSFSLRTFEPVETRRWEAAYSRFLELQEGPG